MPIGGILSLVQTLSSLHTICFRCGDAEPYTNIGTTSHNPPHTQYKVASNLVVPRKSRSRAVSAAIVDTNESFTLDVDKLSSSTTMLLMLLNNKHLHSTKP